MDLERTTKRTTNNSSGPASEWSDVVSCRQSGPQQC